MPIMQWDSSLDVGVSAMNQEHQDILAVMNRIYDDAAQGAHGQPINELVSKLNQVCVRHFADEERYMERIGYPDIDRRRQLHARLLGQLDQYAQAIKAAQGKAPAEFFNFLKFWLTSHIKGIDVRYAAHAGARPAA